MPLYSLLRRASGTPLRRFYFLDPIHFRHESLSLGFGPVHHFKFPIKKAIWSLESKFPPVSLQTQSPLRDSYALLGWRRRRETRNHRYENQGISYEPTQSTCLCFYVVFSLVLLFV